MKQQFIGNGLVIFSEDNERMNVLRQHYDNLVERCGMKIVEKDVYEITLIGANMALAQRDASEKKIKETIACENYSIDSLNPNQVVLVGKCELLAPAFLHYLGLADEGLLEKHGNYLFELNQAGADEIVKRVIHKGSKTC